MNIPGLQELCTGVSILTKSTFGLVTRPFDTDFSNKLLDGACNDMSNYFDTSIVGGTGKFAVQVLTGNQRGAERTLSNVANTMDGIPIVGHAKGVLHLATGDDKHFEKCMKDATRTTAVIGSAALTGGGSLVAAGAASAACGTAYDVTMSGLTNEKYGIVKSIENATDDPSCLVDVVMTLGGDCTTGMVTAKVQQHINKGKKPPINSRKKRSQSTSASNTGKMAGGFVTGAIVGPVSAIASDQARALLLQIREDIKIGGWEGALKATKGIIKLFMLVNSVPQIIRASVKTVINSLERCTKLIKDISKTNVSNTKAFVTQTLESCIAVLKDVSENCRSPTWDKVAHSIEEFQTSITSLMEMVLGIRGS